ncbi:hypothetical protein GCM10022247_33420 [Allokutzneria multivorans]|uniref:Pentapeptide repeat-containing protein n=1 Tax=Allokutzneria multivorans TaxID=1142134 RepID=A0ABP7S9J3_9PSEU
MDFLEVVAGRSIQRPTIELEDLVEDGAGLRGEFDLSEALVHDLDQTGAVGEGSLTASTVRQVNLTDARLAPLHLSDVLLTDVDLSNAVLKRVDARRVELVRCRAIGLRLSVEHAADLFFDGCRLDYADIHVERVKGIAAFRSCSFREARISGDISNIVFADCDFAGTEFDVSGASRCDLGTSRLEGARGLHNLRGAEITRAQAVSVAVELATEAGLSVRD